MQKALIHMALSFVLLSGIVSSAKAQSLRGFHVGDDKSALVQLGDPVATNSYKSFDVRKWSFPNGNELSATVSSAGKIVYLESDWGGHNQETECDLPDLKFGATSLSDLRKRFGSNGFAFQRRGAVLDISDGVVMINSYEIAGKVVTFYTKVSQTPDESADRVPIADRAKLDAVSISDPEYSRSEWGERVYDPKYVQEKTSKIPDGEAQFSQKQLEEYYLVYTNSDVRYLRTAFNSFLSKSAPSEQEREIFDKWPKSYFRSKFIVMSRDPNTFGGTFITILFQEHPDKVFVAWVYPEGRDKKLVLRKMDEADFTEEDIRRINVRYKKLIQDKVHAM